MSDPQIHPSAVIDANVSLGPGCKIWHFVHISANAQLGARCIVGQNVFIGEHVRIGSGVKIQNNVSVYSGVEIEDDVFLGPSCVFTNVTRPRSFIEQKESFKPTRVRQGASIGANATIMCGITIGQYALVGAASLVTKDVPDFALVLGSPARQVGWVDRNGDHASAPPAEFA